MTIIQDTAGGFNSLIGVVKKGRSSLDTLANKYVVKPANAKGISNGVIGFVFDYEGESTVNLAADITDHYVEDNTAVQDHVAIKPKRITLRGYVGELVQLKPAGLLGALGMAQSNLTQLFAYIGGNTPQVVQKLQQAVTAVTSAVNAFDQGLARVQHVVNIFDHSAVPQSRQQIAYAQLESLCDVAAIVSVATPFRFFPSMAIEVVTMTQGEDTKTWSDLTVTLKEIRFAETATGTFDKSKYAGDAGFQNQSVVDKGKSASPTKPVSGLLQGARATMGLKPAGSPQ
jgi:hypothetical protein